MAVDRVPDVATAQGADSSSLQQALPGMQTLTTVTDSFASNDPAAQAQRNQARKDRRFSSRHLNIETAIGSQTVLLSETTPFVGTRLQAFEIKLDRLLTQISTLVLHAELQSHESSMTVTCAHGSQHVSADVPLSHITDMRESR